MTRLYTLGVDAPPPLKSIDKAYQAALAAGRWPPPGFCRIEAYDPDTGGRWGYWADEKDLRDIGEERAAE